MLGGGCRTRAYIYNEHVLSHIVLKIRVFLFLNLHDSMLGFSKLWTGLREAAADREFTFATEFVKSHRFENPSHAGKFSVPHDGNQ